MTRDTDETFIYNEMRRMFRPSARRMLKAARAFVAAWREMTAVESTLKRAFEISHYSVTGDLRSGYDLTLIGAPQNGNFLPTLIDGLECEDLVDLNQQFRGEDNTVSQRVWQLLLQAGIPCEKLKIYHPKGDNDLREIYAHDPNPPKKRLGESPFGASTIVTSLA